MEPTNKELLERIEKLEKQVNAQQTLIIALFELVKNIPQPENFDELGRFMAMLGRYPKS